MKISVLIILNNHYFTYTHCEIHSPMILGVSASIIPFLGHHQSMINVYQSTMGKQAIGIYSANFNIYMDTLANLLLRQFMEFLKLKDLPPGENAIITFNSYNGYNQEDSLN